MTQFQTFNIFTKVGTPVGFVRKVGSKRFLCRHEISGKPYISTNVKKKLKTNNDTRS